MKATRLETILQRKKTLLVEYKQKNKSNRLVDRRFGEGDADLPVEEKMMRRFILEKKVGCSSCMSPTSSMV